MKRGEVMLKYLSLIFSLVLLFSMNVSAQTLEEDYDRRERAVDPFEDEEKLLRQRKISQIISRISTGDKTVLRLVTYDTFNAVHEKIVELADAQGNRAKYYSVVNNRRALPAYVGGFDNQDPKVRLKCIGFLGDWVDEIGQDLGYIEKEVDRRLSTNIETRREVRYGYRVLKMKIVRRRVIGALKSGDENVLVHISPEEFLPLVFYEPRIRTIYLGHPASVKIRSIVLDPGVEPETGRLVTDWKNRQGRASGLNIEEICYTSVTKVGDYGEVAQWIRDRSAGMSVEDRARSYGVSAGGLDWKCLRAVYSGLDNRSLFVREHSARIFLNYVFGLTGDPNYDAGNTRKLSEQLKEMACTPRYVRIAQVAWDNVKWSEYYYSDRVTDAKNFASFIQHTHYMEYNTAGVDTASRYTNLGKRYFTDAVRTQYPEWGTEVTGNYRNDVKEICRILGLSWYLDAEYVQVKRKSIERSRIETLFNPRTKDPDREDILEGEIVE
jgi:hypothetical protein